MLKIHDALPGRVIARKDSAVSIQQSVYRAPRIRENHVTCTLRIDFGRVIKHTIVGKGSVEFLQYLSSFSVSITTSIT